MMLRERYTVHVGSRIFVQTIIIYSTFRSLLTVLTYFNNNNSGDRRRFHSSFVQESSQMLAKIFDILHTISD